MRFLGVPLKIAGRRPAIFQIRFSKKLTYLKYTLGQSSKIICFEVSRSSTENRDCTEKNVTTFQELDFLFDIHIESVQKRLDTYFSDKIYPLQLE